MTFLKKAWGQPDHIEVRMGHDKAHLHRRGSRNYLAPRIVGEWISSGGTQDYPSSDMWFKTFTFHKDGEFRREETFQRGRFSSEEPEKVVYETYHRVEQSGRWELRDGSIYLRIVSSEM